MQKIAIQDLIKSLLERPGMVVLRNPQGTVELKGKDLIMKEHGKWVTVYHGSCENSEERSHLHMRKKSYSYACVREPEGYTAHMTFWESKEHYSEEKPPFAIYFPSFYDWSEGKQEITEHKEYFQQWIKEHGREFELATPRGKLNGSP